MKGSKKVVNCLIKNLTKLPQYFEPFVDLVRKFDGGDFVKKIIDNYSTDCIYLLNMDKILKKEELDKLCNYGQSEEFEDKIDLGPIIRLNILEYTKHNTYYITSTIGGRHNDMFMNGDNFFKEYNIEKDYE